MPLANTCVSVVMQIMGKRGIARLYNSSCKHHVCKLRNVIFQKPFVVSNDQDPHMRSGQFAQAFAHNSDSIAVETGICFVENCESRFQHCQLKNLHSLLFAAGESIVQISPSEFSIDVQLLHRAAEFGPEFPHRHQLFAFFPIGVTDVTDGMPKEVCNLHSGNCDWILKCEEHPETCSLSGIEVENICPVNRD